MVCINSKCISAKRIAKSRKKGVFLSVSVSLTAKIHRVSVTNDYDYILAMLLGSSRNGRLEVTQFSVPITSGTVIVIRRNVLRNTSRLTALSSPMCYEQRWIFNVLTIWLWYTECPSSNLCFNTDSIYWYACILPCSARTLHLHEYIHI